MPYYSSSTEKMDEVLLTNYWLKSINKLIAGVLLKEILTE